MAVLIVQKDCIKSGGIERVNANLAQALTEYGCDVNFYILNGDQTSKEGFNKLSERFQSFRNSKNDSVFKKLVSLRKLIKQHEVDLIISATEQANVLTFFVKLTIPELKVIYTRHVAFDASDQKLPGWAIKLLYSLYTIDGKVVAVSKALRDEIKKNLLWNKPNVVFIPNAVISDNIYKSAKEENAVKPSVDYFIAIGRLVEQKGFDLLLKSYASAVAEEPSLPLLLIIGEGEDRQFLEDMSHDLGLSKRVIFGGFTTNPYRLIKDAKALILSSRHEGMPTVIIESLSLNTPVIAFDCPTGPSELVKTGQNGVLVENANTEQMTDAISKYKSLDYINLEQHVTEFVFANVAKRYLEVAEAN